MNRLLLTLLLCPILFSCMGTPLPFTDARFANWHVEFDREKVNAGCTDFASLKETAVSFETKHLGFITSKDSEAAIRAPEILDSLGPKCSKRVVKLTTAEIKRELFGDTQEIPHPERLVDLGGLYFEYMDVSEEGGIEWSLHLQKDSHGPRRRMVAIYELSTGKVLHYSYTGTDNVDRSRRQWPLDEFFKSAADKAADAAIPGV